MELKEQFEQAVAESKTLSEKPSNDMLLKLYALYKQASIGDVNTDPPSNPFDIVARAKHDAWSALKSKSPQNAMQEYIDLIKELKNG